MTRRSICDIAGEVSEYSNNWVEEICIDNWYSSAKNTRISWEAEDRKRDEAVNSSNMTAVHQKKNYEHFQKEKKDFFYEAEGF